VALSCYFTTYFTDYFATCPPGGSGSATTFDEMLRRQRKVDRFRREREVRNARAAAARDFAGQAEEARVRRRTAILAERELRQAQRQARTEDVPRIVPLPKAAPAAPRETRPDRAAVYERQIAQARARRLRERVAHRRAKQAAERARLIYERTLRKIEQADEEAARDFMLWLMMDED
jgi:hypothetical protein